MSAIKCGGFVSQSVLWTDSPTFCGENALDGPAEAFGEGGFVSCSGGFRRRKKRNHGCKAVGLHKHNVLIPLIKPYRSSKTPLEVFCAVQQTNRDVFFLDSAQEHSSGRRYSYLGMNPFLEISADEKRLTVRRGRRETIYPAAKFFFVVRRIFKMYRMTGSPRADFFTGGAVGFFSYELVEQFERIRLRKKPGERTPLLYLGFFREVIIYDHTRKIYRLTALHGKGLGSVTDAKKRIRKLKKYFELSNNSGAAPSCFGKLAVKKFRSNMSRGSFEKMVRKAKDYIAAGDIYQANLSQMFSFDYSGDTFRLYQRLREINPSPYASYLRTGDLTVVSSSPECLVSKTGRVCETFPIAGTRPRRGCGRRAEDLVRELKTSEKERAEHIMLVDLERNDLGRVCDWRTVKVEEMMRVEKYSHVIHLVSRISGRISKGKDALDLLRAMFPGGTITGCPKVRCMEIIDELEPARRGLYTGSIGYLGFNGDLKLNIVIRTLILNRGKGSLQVGAGIVYDSVPRREYEETLHKAEALLKALGKAGR